MLRHEVKQLIENRLADKQISQNSLSKSLNVSNATINNILHEKWDKVNESMLLTIKNKLKPTGFQLVETRNYREVFNICDHARNHNVFVAIIGNEGLGKTISLQAYHNENPNTFMITCDRGMNPKQIFSELAMVMGIYEQAPVYTIKKNIISAINKLQNPLIIIDEISKVSLSNLPHFQDLWDGISNNAGLIFSGAPHFFDKFKQSATNRKIGMPELYSRKDIATI